MWSQVFLFPYKVPGELWRDEEMTITTHPKMVCSTLKANRLILEKKLKNEDGSELKAKQKHRINKEYFVRYTAFTENCPEDTQRLQRIVRKIHSVYRELSGRYTAFTENCPEDTQRSQRILRRIHSVYRECSGRYTAFTENSPEDTQRSQRIVRKIHSVHRELSRRYTGFTKNSLEATPTYNEFSRSARSRDARFASISI
ncbi:hypothetical protein RRG08_033406 [Elysia crispata]|uniref:Uncharacterized protein n=1 Tax=Elysia crispata TaxID=231223 RepID=A0AAE1A7C6_9GAST|nr:hypothetical protein RRG08_033406 [Elysia crispata]